jgi:2-phospho-L-lactate transferase/gluconeogenesis factor (CofD/UPF0052 family)
MGLPNPFRALKAALFQPGWTWAPARDRRCLAALVTVVDDVASSGLLRREYSVPPPGDVRSCLVALSDGDASLAAIFTFRFQGVS